MAHEILSVKLCELEDQIARMVSRIQLSESADRAQLKQEIKALKQECTENELALQKKLQLSRAGIVSSLAQAYTEIEEAIRKCNATLQAQASGKTRSDTETEKKILLAEYALDFAAQTTNRALLLSMEAIDAQAQQEEGRKVS